MEDFAAHVEFDPEPRSATRARHWMREVLAEIDRPELAESASAAVSELVTNCILHAQTPISVGLQTFGRRVIVTVTDRSPVPSNVRFSPALPRDGESTVGRGLGIVRAYAVDWGVTSSPHGKAIWFVPSDTPQGIDPAAFPEVDLLGEEQPTDVPIEGPKLHVRMLDAPVHLLRHLQDRWNELLREMQLIALGEPSALHDLAQELLELVPITRATRWMAPDSLADLAEAVAGGADRLDLDLDVPQAARAAYERALEILRELNDPRHQDLLLYTTSGKQATQMRDWWFGGIADQLAGAPPEPWPNGFTLDAADQLR